MVVLDASALLAWLGGEPGADLVEDQLDGQGAVVSAVNWSEVAQKSLAEGRDWDRAKALLLSYGLGVEPATEADAEWAARRWRPGEGLSLADRFCLALGQRLGVEVWTADRLWAGDGVRLIR
ncbi:MAG: type II toxin-antitoxin system VapC family toxin [Propionibacteriaceae bacterium]|jgi:PIN domain nuclease of toxin-antitoxin system|nr:type II toxin-antitoxin system VapC family toxin [Propionibacteriaceae bacterium]